MENSDPDLVKEISEYMNSEVDQDMIKRISLRIGEEWEDQVEYDKAVAALCKSLDITLNSVRGKN